jgi:hypothetical protein
MQINKIKKYQHQFVINHVYSVLCGMLGSMIIFTAYYFVCQKPKEIAIVNITSIVNDYIKEESKLNKSQDDLTKEVKNFGRSLEKTLRKVSQDGNVILMPSEAVIAGSQDYTDLIKANLKDK